jgi:hypothetical protein
MPSVTGPSLARQRELFSSERGGLVVLAEGAVRGDRGGAPRCDGRVRDAQGLPALAGREQIGQGLVRAVLRDPQRAAGLAERERVGPALRRIPSGGHAGHGVGLVQAAQAGERLHAQCGSPGHGQRRGGRELEVQRQPRGVGRLLQPPEPPQIIECRQLACATMLIEPRRLASASTVSQIRPATSNSPVQMSTSSAYTAPMESGEMRSRAGRVIAPPSADVAASSASLTPGG